MPSHYEPGPYVAKITAQRFGETPNGSPYFALMIEPTASKGANTLPAQIYEREITLYVTDKSYQYTVEKLRKLGWQGSKFSELDPSNDEYHSFVDLELDVTCSLNEKGYDEWNLSKGGGKDAPGSDSSVAKKLDTLFGKALMSSAPAKPKKATKPKAAADIPDSECPF